MLIFGQVVRSLHQNKPQNASEGTRQDLIQKYSHMQTIANVYKIEGVGGHLNNGTPLDET